MKTLYLNKRQDYDGSQLKSHWILEKTGLLGDAAVSFIGGCDIKPEHMVDLVDKKDGARIYSEEMLHFLIELFKRDVEHAVFAQHLLVSIIGEEIAKKVPDIKLKRIGNDLYQGGAKLNISIATASPVSALIHVGINISNRNTPVLTKGLKNYKIPPKEFAKAILKRFLKEIDIINKAICKARPVQ